MSRRVFFGTVLAGAASGLMVEVIKSTNDYLFGQRPGRIISLQGSSHGSSRVTQTLSVAALQGSRSLPAPAVLLSNSEG